MGKIASILFLLFAVGIVSCSSDDDDALNVLPPAQNDVRSGSSSGAADGDQGSNANGDNGVTTDYSGVSEEITKYTDAYGDVAYIPGQFKVSDKPGEQVVRTGLVVIGPDGSEFVWVSTKETPLRMRDFGSYFSGGSLSGYQDDTSLSAYQAMATSVASYEGFYMGRYEASYGSGNSLSNYVPASKPVTSTQSGRIWVQFSPQDATVACENLYSDNPTVQGFFPWGANWDTTLQWLVDTGCKTYEEVASNSTSWGNYSDDDFSPGAHGNYTGVYEEAKANNIYDLAGNNWEWTQERYGSNYVMRSGGYNLMGGACPGSRYPAAIRDPLPGNNHHPNVCFRIGLFLLPVEAVDDSTSGIRDVTI